MFKPRLWLFDNDTWIEVKEAARILGVGLSEVYGNLCSPDAPYLVSRRPLSQKILISLKSVESFRRLTVNPDFWKNKRLMDTRLAETRAAIAALCAPQP